MLDILFFGWPNSVKGAAFVALPNFFLIGAAKAGTSSIYNYLWQHPDVYMSPNKEPNFFVLDGEPARFAGPGDDIVNIRSVHARDEYEALFADRTTEKMMGEASPPYLRSEIAAECISKLIPTAKLIAVLRNPIDRAFSCFQHAVRDNRETKSTFIEALACEAGRIEANWENLWYYTEGGLYHKQLQYYYSRFPSDQIAVYLYDDFAAEPQMIMQSMFDFLGVDAFEPDMSVHYNVSGQARSQNVQKFLVRSNPFKDLLKPFIPSYLRQRLINQVMSLNVDRSTPEMSEEDRRYLIGVFHDDVMRLQDLLQRDLSGWLRVEAETETVQLGQEVSKPPKQKNDGPISITG